MKRVIIAWLIALLLPFGQALAATTLLPNGEQCFQATTGLNGMVGVLGTITGGSGYTAGTYGGIPLTGGSGTGATASIVVAGGAVTSIVIQNPGVNYVVGDVLSAAAANIGGTGAGFSVPVSSISVNSSLANGSVNMFIPNTTTPKATWKDAGQVMANTQPIILDTNGCAIIYGIGSYRQQVFDSLGNLIFDQPTTDTSAQQNVFWAGQASGTPNAITITDPGFNGTDGSIINFFPALTNTGATTISIAASAFTNIAVVKDTTGGAVGLTGGEIVQTGTPNIVSVLYSAVQNDFHLLNTAIASASGATAPLCGAVGLKITNGGTPNTLAAITARQVVMQSANGLTINRSNISVTVNTTLGNITTTVGGMDGEAPGINAWIDLFAIDNGAAPSAVGSLAAGNGLAPNMPSGYTYKCYLGAMRVDGSGNFLRTLQLGSTAQYAITTGSNTTTPPAMVSGGSGGLWTALSTSAFVPPTAAQIRLSAGSLASLSANAQMCVAPNNNYAMASCQNSGAPIVLVNNNASGIAVMGVHNLVLESANIYYGTSAVADGYVNAMGWVDAVNAN